jgi:TonB-linked SusC/RagA family outer membrane protein
MESKIFTRSSLIVHLIPLMRSTFGIGILILGLQLTSLAQENRVSGKVTSEEDGLPLPGVNVLVKGTTIGTVTDSEGNYSIAVQSGESTLVFSFIGFLMQEVSIAGKSEVNVVMSTDIQTLGEVVVVGYGVQKKINLTGAVGTVKSDYINDRPLTNVSQALSGGVAGVFVNQNSGAPGTDAATIRIRGIGTLNNTNPLVLVDGIESSMSNLDPNDVETISVLKDAASAAIYGSRASNGVILITTKRGKLNTPPTITYTGYVGVSEATRIPKMVTSTSQFMELANEAALNSGIPERFTPEEIARYAPGGSNAGPNTDWVKELIKTGAMQQHNISISGGGANTNYLLSLGTLNQDAITPNTNYKRHTLRLNIDSKVTEKLKIGTALFLARNHHDSWSTLNEGYNGFINGAISASPLYPAYDAQGRYAGLDQSLSYKTWIINPLSKLYNSSDLIKNQFLGNVFAEYELVKGLFVKGMLGYNFNSDDGYSFASKGELFDWVSGLAIEPPINQNRARYRSYSTSTDLTSWLQARYEKKINNHEFSILAGVNQESYQYNGFGTGRTTFPSNSVHVLDAGNALTATNYEDATEWALRSFFGRLTYNFNEKYLFEFNIRRDGSSRFIGDNRYGVFPSVSAGWIISKEPFFQGIQQVDLLKLRVSSGQLGNQYAVGNDYPYAAQASTANYVLNGNVVVPGAAQTTFDNPDIKWETTTSSDIGLDLGLFQRINVEADYFVRTTKDILYPRPVPATAGGFETPIVNTGKVRNQGWEFSIRYQHEQGPVHFSIAANVSHITSELLYIDESKSAEDDEIISGNAETGNRILKRGEALNSLYGLKAIGIFQNVEEIDSSPVQFGSYAPGDLKFADINADGVIDSEDYVIMGKEDPTWIYGANFSISFKGLDLSGIFQGVSDFESYSGVEYYSPFFDGANVGTQWIDRWTPSKPTSTPRIFWGTGPSTDRSNSYWVQDRSFLRLKNLQLGYSLPGSILQKTGIKKLRIYINAQNLFTVTDFKGFDPERPEGSHRGGDAYPLLKIYSAGLNLTF